MAAEAAAATPVGSISCVRRVAETKATLSATCRSSIAAPPRRSGSKSDSRGGVSSAPSRSSRRLSSSAT